ncbi:MAG TPA: hypothetical protein VK668_06565 [Mucilaginibacter sp.]|nr:hypothetical protein [Mucilaginibacter sp.]
MPETSSAYTSSWFSKMFECLYLYIAFTWVAGTLISTYSVSHPAINRSVEFYSKLFTYAGIAGCVAALAYSLWWHRKEGKQGFNSAIKHAWLRGVLRYFLAYDVSLYGFGKILKTQFAHVYFRDDIPVGNLSGFELTWNYFGYSHTFAVILGLCQIGGAILLLFRRTSLLGVCILLPVMVNVVLINAFYHIGGAPYLNSVVITIGLLHLLLLRWRELKALFFSRSIDIPPVHSGVFKWLMKFAAIAAAFGSIYYFVATRPTAPFAGKWKVTELKRNGKVLGDSAWRTDPTAWCNIYIEEGGKLALSPNPYIYDIEKALKTGYQYDATKHNLKLIISENYIIDVAISQYDGKTMQWNTVMSNDTLQMKLTKETRTADN